MWLGLVVEWRGWDREVGRYGLGMQLKGEVCCKGMWRLWDVAMSRMGWEVKRMVAGEEAEVVAEVVAEADTDVIAIAVAADELAKLNTAVVDVD
jgi:hypothetical protein